MKILFLALLLVTVTSVFSQTSRTSSVKQINDVRFKINTEIIYYYNKLIIEGIPYKILEIIPLYNPKIEKANMIYTDKYVIISARWNDGNSTVSIQKGNDLIIYYLDKND